MPHILLPEKSNVTCFHLVLQSVLAAKGLPQMQPKPALLKLHFSRLINLIARAGSKILRLRIHPTPCPETKFSYPEYSPNTGTVNVGGREYSTRTGLEAGPGLVTMVYCTPLAPARSKLSKDTKLMNGETTLQWVDGFGAATSREAV